MRVAMSLILFAVAPMLWAGTAYLKDVRMWAAPDRTRVVFDLTGPVEHKVFTLENPNRVVVDIRNAHLPESLKTPQAGKGYVQRIRTGVRKGTDLRVVLDLKRSTDPKSFTLTPNGDYGHRLVIDLEGGAEILRAKAEEPDASQPEVGVPEPQKRPATALEQDPQPQPADRAQTKSQIIEAHYGKKRQVIVAVDAGHGGEDPGARGPRGTREKDVVLQISRRLAKLINTAPGMKAVLIRDGDYYVGLRERMIKARAANADLFVSIHADAFRSRSANGGSVYVLSNRGASSEHAAWLAKRENASDLIGGVSIKDKDDALASFMLDLSQSASMEASYDLAKRVLKELGDVGRLHKHSVQQAGFMVLKSPDIPSILVETAFISNYAEENLLRSAAHQEKLAKAVLKGIQGYFDAYRPGSLITVKGVEEQPRKHTIKRGESLSEIAADYQVSVDYLRRNNGIEGDTIRPGQVLQIP